MLSTRADAHPTPGRNGTVTVPAYPIPRAKAVAVELATTLGKAAMALAIFFGVTSTFSGVQAGRMQGDAASQPLPNDVDGRCALWFIGSSSMRRWTTLERDMRPWTAHNRAIGGATLTELSDRFAVEKSPTPPRAVIFYAGENDLAYGVPESTVIEEFRAFLDRKTATLGDVPVFFVSVKPSPTRLRFLEAQARYNAAVRRLAAERADLFFVDVVPSLAPNGRLGPFYDADGIHMNTAGYQVWTRGVRAALRTGLPRELVGACDAT